MEKCRNCEYAIEISISMNTVEDERGTCRKKSPTVFFGERAGTTRENDRAVWPVVILDEPGCGEYRTRMNADGSVIMLKHIEDDDGV